MRARDVMFVMAVKRIWSLHEFESWNLSKDYTFECLKKVIIWFLCARLVKFWLSINFKKRTELYNCIYVCERIDILSLQHIYTTQQKHQAKSMKVFNLSWSSQ